ncbi:4-diphosphocytidyl-2-c-methyl-d-erythritol kinase [Quercus suber]|uniref:4-diphosphocytidyl-2-c-methyl-d-erythritol kinase n=1 Tax=Quercus suber TaxID=58331 RepID=A0AAW0L5D5_QUESU
MASSHFLCSHHVFLPSYNSFKKSQSQSQSQSHLSLFKPNGSSSFHSNSQFKRIRAMASDSNTPTRRKVEVVYNPEERINKLADEVDKEAPLSRLTLFSPCKVISLGDILKFSLSPSKTKDSLSTNVSGVPLDDRNLIIKALNLYRKKTGSEKFFWIHLDKKVPTGAGLGGGSSNAATALWAANQFNGCLATEKELQEWSSEIGSDVPFFFSQGAAYCTGRGEVVQNIPPPVPLDIPMVLIKPQQACSTAEVYKRLRLDQTSKVDPLTLLEKISTNGISQDVCINDLEPPAFEVLPSLRRLKQRVNAASRGQYDARQTFSLVKQISGTENLHQQVLAPHPPIFPGLLIKQLFVR